MSKSSVALILIAIMLNSCGMESPNHKQCNSKVEGYIKIFNSLSPSRGIASGYYLYSLLFLMELTELQSNANFGDIVSYEGTAYQRDSVMFNDWYAISKSKINCAAVDSVELEIALFMANGHVLIPSDIFIIE